MADIIEFKPTRKEPLVSSHHMISLNIYQCSTGELEVDAQISDGTHTDYEIFEAIMAAAWKFAEDSDLVEETEELELGEEE